MVLMPVHFEYVTGLSRPFLLGARLSGDWDEQGLRSEQWLSQTMQPFTAEDGCPAFRLTVGLDDSQVGQAFHWGAMVSTDQTPDVWGIPTEVDDAFSTDRVLSFILHSADQTERYYLTHCRRLGANKLVLDGQPAIRFAVWAPNARNVEVVRGMLEGEEASTGANTFIASTMRGGYIYSSETDLPALPMHRGEDGVWVTNVEDHPVLQDFGLFDHQPYMYRVTRDDGVHAYRTDLYSRCQIGTGGVDPEAPNSNWTGLCRDLDGSKSCSVVVDPEEICEVFEEIDSQGRPVWPETRWLSEEDFWWDEFDPDRPVPTRFEDLVIYELQVDRLGLERGVDRGTLQDALNLLPYLRDLGVNAIELTPIGEFLGSSGWGYTISRHSEIERAGDRRDKFKHFVRECHRNGLAVILDVVYNYYTFDAERSEWAYDSASPERNIYYWYEGSAGDYSQNDGGYVDNGSSGWTPRYWAHMVRKRTVSSAAALVSEFHFDGSRVDLAQAIHRDNVRHADGRPVEVANLFGQKLLREWSNTLRLIRPNVFLIAEDHTGGRNVFQPTDRGGLGFDAVWAADYYHHLIGDAQDDPGCARLIRLSNMRRG